MDTKGPEALYVRKKIDEQGLRPTSWICPPGAGGRAAERTSGRLRWQGRRASLNLLASSSDRGRNTEAIVSGAVKIAHRLLRENRIHGILGLGGYSGSLMTSEVMHSCPSLSKILVSSAAAILVSRPGSFNERHPPVPFGGRNCRIDRAAQECSGAAAFAMVEYCTVK